MQESLKKSISKALDTIGVSGVSDIPLEHPGDLKNGDYATGVVLHCAKQAGKSPRALAEEVVAALGDVPGISKIEIAGPGFINFYLSTEEIANSLKVASAEDMPARQSLGVGGGHLPS